MPSETRRALHGEDGLDADLISEDAPAAAEPERTARPAERSGDEREDRSAEASGLPWAGNDDRRREIAEAVRRQRQGNPDPDNPDDDEIEAPDEAVVVGLNDADDADADVVVAPKPKPKPAPAAKKADVAEAAAAEKKRLGLDELDDDVVLEITVNGQTVETSVGDLIANAGRYMAGEQHLERAREILKGARSAQPEPEDPDDSRSRQHQPARRSDGSQPAETVTAKPAADRERARELADRIQGGTLDEATDAILEVWSGAGTVAERAATNVSTADRMEQQFRSEVNSALTRVAQSFPEINDDDDLVGLTAKRANEAIKKALRDIDIREADQLDSWDPMKLMRAYSSFQRANPDYKLSSIDDVFHQSAAATYKWRFGEDPDPERLPSQQDDTGARPELREAAPVRQQPSSDRSPIRRTGVRVVRKSSLITQPRPASIRANGSEAPQRSREERAEIVVDRMREDRNGIRIPAAR